MRTRALYALLIVAAGARLMLAVAAMPPYAGLDEAWHVARVAFVSREHRQPNIVERSIPPYIARSIRGEELPAFGEMRKRWPEVVRRGHVVVERPFAAGDLAPYESANYEAQQPPLYYAIAAKLAPLGILQSYAAPEPMAAEIRGEFKRVSEMARKTGLVKSP